MSLFLYPRMALVFGLSLVCTFAQPVITEFVASNNSGLSDEDGAFSDWIEIHNPSATALNLDGWYLTDRINNRTMWRVPAVIVPAQGFLVVFASSKNRTNPAAPLHTNFSLSTSGEYLGLVHPDGATVVSEFAPTFPAQQADVSYGVTQPVESVTILAQGSAARGLIPTATFDSTHGTAWRAAAFNDTAWSSGTLGLGYGFPSQVGIDVGAMRNVNGSAYLRTGFNIVTPANILGLSLNIVHDDGFAAWLNGTPIGSRLAPDLASLSWNSLAIGDNANPLANPVTLDLTAALPSLVAGDNVLAIHGLNRSLDSSDLLLLPTLTAQVPSTTEAPQPGYFPTPTPGARNGNASTLILPERVTFSPTDGTFATSRTLTLSGANSAVGQKIRYVLTAPSSAGANPAEPTAASTLYTGPITLTDSRLVSAAVFSADDTRRNLPTFSQHLALETAGENRSDTFTSIMPITVLDLHGFGPLVKDGIYRTAWLHQFAPATGPSALLAPPTLATRGEMRVRGSSSAGFPKKGYNLEVHDSRGASRNLSLLGLPADDDWALVASWLYDKSHIHNAFAYEMSNRIGRYAPRTRLTDVFSNFSGGKLDLSDYAGIYTLMERIQVGPQRVAVTPLNIADITAPAITGGYILKIDRADPDEYSWLTNRGLPNSGYTAVVVHAPELDRLAPAQRDYIRNYVQAMEDALYTDRESNWATRNYLNYLDRASWVDHHILNVLAKNVDGLRLSGYFHKNRGGKIIAGPVWDFDRSLGSADGRDADPTGWRGTGDATDYWNYEWWGTLARDPDFQQAWIDRWQSLRSTTFSTPEFHGLVDQLSGQIGAAAAARDAAKWPDNASRFTDYAGEISHLKNWIASRANWIDGNFTAAPTSTAPAATTRMLSPALGTTILYTVDGSDPRLSGGATSPSAFTITTPVRFDGALTLRARVLHTNAVSFPGSNWSGLLAVDVAAPAGFAGWSAARLPGRAPAEQAIAADPDGDGHSNLIEYALDLDPATADATLPGNLLRPLFVEEGSVRYLEYTYRRRLDRPEVALRVESAPDLSLSPGANWTTASDSRLSLDGVIETRRARIVIGSAPRVFVRLVATTVP